MPTTCAVFGCHNRQTRRIKRSFYRIPRDFDHRRRWLAFIGRRNEDGSPWEPGTGDQVCSDHFLSKKKLDLSTNPDYIPSVRSTQDSPRVNEGAVERIERRHSTQQANEKEKSYKRMNYTVTFRLLTTTTHTVQTSVQARAIVQPWL